MAITKKSADYTVTVLRAHQFNGGNIVFDIQVNGVKIYGMKYIESKKGSFISFPQYKGADGKYWSHAYFEITEEIQSDIEKQIEALL